MRRIWTVIVMAFAASTVVYGFVAFLMTMGARPPDWPAPPQSVSWVLHAFAALSLLGGMILFTRSTEPAEIPPPRFMQRTILSLALCAAAALAGMALAVLLRSVTAYIAPGLAVFAVMVLFILPRGLQYWGLVESASTRRRP